MIIVGFTTSLTRQSQVFHFGAMYPASGEQVHNDYEISVDSVSCRLDITTSNPATQVYTAYWLNTPRKAVHGGPNLTYDSFSAVAIEQEGYIDAINTPEWHIDQICELI